MSMTVTMGMEEYDLLRRRADAFESQRDLLVGIDRAVKRWDPTYNVHMTVKAIDEMIQRITQEASS